MSDEETVWADVEVELIYPCVDASFARNPQQHHLNTDWYSEIVDPETYKGTGHWRQIPKSIADKYQQLRDELDEVEQQLLKAYKYGKPLASNVAENLPTKKDSYKKSGSQDSS